MPRTELGVAPSVIVDHREHQRRRQLVPVTTTGAGAGLSGRRMAAAARRRLASVRRGGALRLDPSLPCRVQEAARAEAAVHLRGHEQQLRTRRSDTYLQEYCLRFLEVLVLCIGCQFMY